MKLITAIVQPERLADIQIALVQHGVAGMTISECSGYARQHGHSEIYRGEQFTVNFVLKVRVEILASDADAEGIINVIADNGRTGQVGDGKVWIVHVDDVVRVRTGERGIDAI